MRAAKGLSMEGRFKLSAQYGNMYVYVLAMMYLCTGVVVVYVYNVITLMRNRKPYLILAYLL